MTETPPEVAPQPDASGQGAPPAPHVEPPAPPAATTQPGDEGWLGYVSDAVLVGDKDFDD